MSAQIETRSSSSTLSEFYAAIRPFSDPILRIAAGAILLEHGVVKLMSGPAPVIASMARLGLSPAAPFAYWIMFLETLGALAVIFGLFTRFFAVCLAIEMAVIAFAVQFPHGFSASHGGYEMTLMWSLVFVAIALRGGGEWSLDRKIGLR